MVFAGGPHQFRGFMEVLVLFGRVPARLKAISLQLYCFGQSTNTVFITWLLPSSVFTLQVNFFFSFSDLTYGLVIMTVSLFSRSLLSKNRKVLIPTEKKDRGPQPVDPSVKLLLKMRQLEAANNMEIRHSVSSPGTGPTSSEQATACLPVFLLPDKGPEGAAASREECEKNRKLIWNRIGKKAEESI